MYCMHQQQSVVHLNLVQYYLVLCLLVCTLFMSLSASAFAIRARKLDSHLKYGYIIAADYGHFIS